MYVMSLPGNNIKIILLEYHENPKLLVTTPEIYKTLHQVRERW